MLNARIKQVSLENAALEGKRPTGSSRWQAVANFECRVAALAGLSVQGNVRHFGSAYYQDMNRTKISDRTLANLGAQYEARLGDKRQTLTGNVNNLLNRKYWNLNTLGDARKVSVAVRVAW